MSGQAIKIVRFQLDGKLYDVDPTTFSANHGGTQYTSLNSHRPNTAVQAETIAGTCSVDYYLTPDVVIADLVGTGKVAVAEYDNGMTFKMAAVSNSSTPDVDTDGGKVKIEYTGNPWEQTAP